MLKKILGVALSVVMSVALIEYTPTEVKAANISASFNSTTKTLTITGTGAMPDLDSDDSNIWRNYLFGVDHLVIGEGITQIGDSDFVNYMFTTVSLPSTLTSINTSAFQNCRRLTSVTFPANIEYIGGDAFDGCEALEDITFTGTNLTEIGYEAFKGCALTNVLLPDNVAIIDYSCFENCPMTEITIQKNCEFIGYNAIPYTAVIKGYSGSVAAQYAEDYMLEFISLGLEPKINIDGFMLDANIDTVRTVFSTSLSPEHIQQVGLLTAYANLGSAKMVYDTTLTNVTKYVMSPSENDTSLSLITQYTGSCFKHDRTLSANTSPTSKLYLRAYAILDDNSVIYTKITNYSLADLASALYYSEYDALSSKYIYDTLYTKVLSKVASPVYEQVDYPAKKTYYRSFSFLNDEQLIVDGYQFSPASNGFRTVFTINDGIDYTECGLIIGIHSNDSQWSYLSAPTEEGMVIGSNADCITSYKSTCAGLAPVNMSSIFPDGDSYVMTFPLNTDVNELQSTYYFRAYAKLSDGTYIYSPVSSTSIHTIANYIYTEKSVNSLDAYNYIFNNILKIVNPSASSIPFQWYYPTYTEWF